MSDSTPEQIQTCKESVSGMKQAQTQGNKEAFERHKANLDEVLKAIETTDRALFAKFSTYRNMNFD